MGRSVDDIRRESERNRAELARTVDALRGKITDTADDIRHKVSPAHIKEEVSDYVADKRRHWVNALKQQAMDNPMQTVATGMALAVPALRLVRAIPLPLLMVGAGLALSSKRVRDAVSDKLPFDPNAVIDQTRDAAANVSEKASEFADAARQRFQDARESVRDSADVMRDAAGLARDIAADTYDDLRDKASELQDTAAQTYGQVRDQMRGKASQAAASVRTSGREYVGEATAFAAASSKTLSDELVDGGREVAGNIRDAAQSAKDRAAHVVRDNAALIGGLGLAVGALIAAALPATRGEKSVLGAASNSVRRQASNLAQAGLDQAAQAANSAVDGASAAVREADLTSGLDALNRRVGEKLKTVADEAVTTAFEPDQSHSQNLSQRQERGTP